jgi:hypothetical protein
MYNIYDLINFFKNNINVSTEIKEYIEASFENGQLKTIDLNSTPLIFKFKLLEEIKGKLLIKNEYFNYMLFLFLKEKLEYSEINNYENYGDFTIKAKKEIEKLKPFYDTWNNFEIFMFIYFNQTKGWDFKEYLLKFDTKSESRNFFFLKFNFSGALPYLKISEESLTEIFYHLFYQKNQDLSFGELFFNAVQEYSHQQPIDGWKLVKYMIKNKKREFIVSILVGLSKVDFNKTFEYTKQLFHRENFSQIAIYAFGVFEYKDYKYIEDILNLFESVDSDEESILVALAKSYGYLVHKPLIQENGKTDYLFGKLNALAKRDIPKVQYNILVSVFKEEKPTHREKKYELLMNFTKVDNKDKVVISIIEYALNTLKEPKLILKFIESWVLNHPIENYKEIFSYPLHEAYNRNPTGFIENYLSLLIHNKGKVRFYANNNTDFIQITEKNKEIWKEHLWKLENNQLIKFINSILSGTFKPEERMKLVLILLHKKDDKIFKYILQRFVWLVHDYGGTVKETVETFLDNQNPLEKKFIDSFQICYRKIVNFWKKKNMIKEFNPYENQAVYASKFDKIFYKKQSEDSRKSVEKQSVFSQFCTKITISRGRKFKIGTNDQYSEMNELETVLTMPRTYFIFPELYDYKRRQMLADDWEEKS